MSINFTSTYIKMLTFLALTMLATSKLMAAPLTKSVEQWRADFSQSSLTQSVNMIKTSSKKQTLSLTALKAAVLSENIILIEAVIDHTNIAKVLLIEHYKKALVKHRKFWRYSLTYLNVQKGYTPLNYLSEDALFLPNLVLIYRLLSEPESNYFNELRARIFIKRWQSVPHEELLAKLEEFYDVTQTDSVALLIAHHVITSEQRNKNTIAKYYLDPLIEKNYSPALYLFAEYAKIFNPDLPYSKRRNIEFNYYIRAAEIGHPNGASSANAIQPISAQTRYELNKLIKHKKWRYKEDISSLLNDEIPGKGIKEAGQLFLQAIEQAPNQKYKFEVPDKQTLNPNDLVPFIKGFNKLGDRKLTFTWLNRLLTTGCEKMDTQLLNTISSVVSEIDNVLTNANIVDSISEKPCLKPLFMSLYNSKPEMFVKGESLLSLAIKQGNIAKAKEMLSKGKLLDESLASFSALFRAIEGKHKSLFEPLLAITNLTTLNRAYDYDQKRLLHLAVASGNRDLIKKLLDKGADPKLTDIYGRSAIDWAMEMAIPDVLVALGSKPQDARLATSPKKCIKDKETGLYWMNKLQDTGIYSWSVKTNLYPVPDCQYKTCDIKGVLQELNDKKYCGRSDWRMPFSIELNSIAPNILSKILVKPKGLFYGTDKNGILHLLMLNNLNQNAFNISTQNANFWPVSGKPLTKGSNDNIRLFSTGNTIIFNEPKILMRFLREQPAEISFKLALQYLNGDVLPKSESKALTILNKLHSKKNITAASTLAHYHKNKEPNKAFNYISDALTFANNEGQKHFIPYVNMLLGQYYLEGIGVEVNVNKATKLLATALSNNMAEAGWILGEFYKKNSAHKQAFFYTKRAANLMHIQSQFSVAKMYHEGLGVKMSTKSALEWYEKAAKNGHKDSINILLNAYKNELLGLSYSKNKIDELSKRLKL